MLVEKIRTTMTELHRRKIEMNNKDFLFITDATLSNPNGNPDDENRPRMDYDTKTLLVSDVRVKRTWRDFAKEKGYEILISTSNDEKVTLENKIKEVLTKYGVDIAVEKGSGKKDAGKNKAQAEAKINCILDNMLDIRLFGSAMAVDGIAKTFTGPVQISWGYSLHPVDLVKASAITSIMSSKDETEGHSTFGQMHKAEYAMIVHCGSINKNAAKKTRMTDEDAELFPKLLVQSLMNNQTHSKQGQQPLLYLEVEYSEDFDGFLGDLRRYIDVELHKEYAIRSMNDLTVDFTRLSEVVDEYKKLGYIKQLSVWVSPLVKTDKHFIGMPECMRTLKLVAPIRKD